MPSYDGSIRINTRIDSKGFNAGVKSMMNSLGSLAASFGVAFGIAGLVAFGKKSVETAKQMEAGWQGLVYTARAHGRDIQQMEQFLKDYTADGLVPMLNAQIAYRNMLARGYDTDQLEKMLLVMKDSAVYLRKGRLDIGEAIENTTMGLRTERSILSDSSGIEQNMYKMWQAYAKEQGTTIANLTLEQKRIAEFEGFMKEGAIYAGAAAKYTDTYAGRVAKLNAAMVGLRVSVGNVFIPIINALIPAIINLVTWFTRLFNIVGRVMNLFFGSNVGMVDAQSTMAQDAQATADAMDQTATNTERAGKAAKGALASFDKLNVLQQTEKGAGSGTVVGIPGAEKHPVETDTFSEKIDELGEKIERFKRRFLAFFKPLRESLALLGSEFKRLGLNIIAGLGWVWENILKPLVTWLGQEAAPVAITIFAGALDVLNSILEALSPLGIWLWEEFLQPIGEWAGGKFIEALTWISEKLTAVSDWISNNQEIVQTIAIILGSFALAWGLVNAAIGIWNVVGVIATAVTTAFGAAVAFLTSPIGIVILAIGAVIAIVVLLIKHWDEVKEWAINAWNKIKETWQVAADWFKNIVLDPIKARFGPVFNFIAILVNNTWVLIKEGWKYAPNWFKEKILDPIKNFFILIWDAIASVVIDVWEKIKKVWNVVHSWFKSTVLDPLVSAFVTAWNAIADPVSRIFNGIVGVIKTAINDAIGLINGMIGSVFNGTNTGINFLNEKLGILPGWKFIPNLGVPKIPYLATGAVIPPNAPFAAILGDQRSGTNIEAPEALIRQIIRDELSGMRPHNTEDRMIHNQITLSGRVIYDEIKRIERQLGTSMLARSAT